LGEQARRAKACAALFIKTARGAKDQTINDDPRAEGSGVLHRSGEVTFGARVWQRPILRTQTHGTAIWRCCGRLDQAAVGARHRCGIRIGNEVGRQDQALAENESQALLVQGTARDPKAFWGEGNIAVGHILASQTPAYKERSI
jgi:hypothetical protein